MQTFKDEKHRDKIIDRIQKILALAEDTTFENEANTAFKMAKNLMVSYGLDMSEVEMKEAIQNNIIEGATEGIGKMFNWQKILAMTISTLCDTKLIFSRQNKKTKLKFIGFKDDVNLSIQLYNALILKMKLLSSKYYHDKRNKNSYLLGMSDCLLKRAKVETKEAKEIKTYNSLVVVKDQEIKNFVNNKYNNLKKGKIHNVINKEAYNKGQCDGKNIDLGSQAKIT